MDHDDEDGFDTEQLCDLVSRWRAAAGALDVRGAARLGALLAEATAGAGSAGADLVAATLARVLGPAELERLLAVAEPESAERLDRCEA